MDQSSVWCLYIYKEVGVGLNPRPGDFIGRFFQPCRSIDAALYFIEHYGQRAEIIGEKITGNGWHLIAVQYGESTPSGVGEFTMTWAIDERPIYQLPVGDET